MVMSSIYLYMKILKYSTSVPGGWTIHWNIHFMCISGENSLSNKKAYYLIAIRQHDTMV